VLRQSTYGTIKFGIYYSLKNWINDHPQVEDMMTNVFCGVVAGAVSSAIANPTDVLKVNFFSIFSISFTKGYFFYFFLGENASVFHVVAIQEHVRVLWGHQETGGHFWPLDGNK